eukprot:6198937-Pleurochrysis_carterae.AAC.2
MQCTSLLVPKSLCGELAVKALWHHTALRSSAEHSRSSGPKVSANFSSVCLAAAPAPRTGHSTRTRYASAAQGIHIKLSPWVGGCVDLATQGCTQIR